ncbi:MAG: hypothetical protein ACLQLG_13950 [Thermoguttaceae bacterium]
MEIEEFVQRRSDAAQEFNLHEDRSDGLEIAGSLASGLTILRDALYKRVHEDVQRQRGMDSILMPISEEKSERLAKIEIELYQIAVSAAAAQRGDYAGADAGWYWQWLARLRLGPSQPEDRVTKRVECYLAKSRDQRRLLFSDVMARALPESRHAPLVLFRLLPLAIEIVTALGFGDSAQAAEVRQSQSDILPGIADCEQCRGKLLDNGQQCPACGNPLWQFDRLTAID